MFGRKPADVHMMQKEGTQKMVRDDELHIVSTAAELSSCVLTCTWVWQNTQSGSQWDGLRHFACLTEGVFYNKWAWSCSAYRGDMH